MVPAGGGLDELLLADQAQVPTRLANQAWATEPDGHSLRVRPEAQGVLLVIFSRWR